MDIIIYDSDVPLETYLICALFDKMFEKQLGNIFPYIYDCCPNLSISIQT